MRKLLIELINELKVRYLTKAHAFNVALISLHEEFPKKLLKKGRKGEEKCK